MPSNACADADADADADAPPPHHRPGEQLERQHNPTVTDPADQQRHPSDGAATQQGPGRPAATAVSILHTHQPHGQDNPQPTVGGNQAPSPQAHDVNATTPPPKHDGAAPPPSINHRDAAESDPKVDEPLVVDAPSASDPTTATSSTNASSITEQELEVLEPPQNFAMVEPRLYRSSLPGPGGGGGGGGTGLSAAASSSSSSSSALSSSHASFLRGLRLRTVIILSSEKPGRSVTRLLARVGARVVHTGLSGWSLLDGASTTSLSWKPMADEVVKETVELILQRHNYPILLCDVGGVYNVGMVVACLRRLQGWTLTSTINEYRSFAAGRPRYINELFIELFDTDLITVPQNPPDWFVNLARADVTDYDQFQFLVAHNRLDQYGTLVRDYEPWRYEQPPQEAFPKAVASDKVDEKDDTARDGKEVAKGSSKKDGDDVNVKGKQKSKVKDKVKNKEKEKEKEKTKVVDLPNIPKYRVYYFSTASPLNSDFSKVKPRIQSM